MNERPILLEQFIASYPAMGNLAVAIFHIFTQAENYSWDAQQTDEELDKVLKNLDQWQLFTSDMHDLPFGSPTALAFLRALAHSQAKSKNKKVFQKVV